MELQWKPMSQPRHFCAETEFGTYLLGPRKSDGFWEYCTPDEDWGDHNEHMLDDLSEAKARTAAQADYTRRLQARKGL